MGATRKQLVQTVIFMQGDDADEVFKIIYPDMDGVSTGWATRKSIAEAMAYMQQWDCGDGLGSDVTEYGGNFNEHKTATHIMSWDFSYGWVSLERKVTQKEAALIRG